MRARLVSADGCAREIEIDELRPDIYTMLTHLRRGIYQPGYAPMTPAFGPAERRKYTYGGPAADGVHEYREVWQLSRWAECRHCRVLHYLDREQARAEVEL